MAEEQKQSEIQMVHGKVLNEYKDNKDIQDFLDKAFIGPDDKHKIIVLRDSDPESGIDRLIIELLMQLGIFDELNNQSE